MMHTIWFGKVPFRSFESGQQVRWETSEMNSCTPKTRKTRDAPGAGKGVWGEARFLQTVSSELGGRESVR